jgi:hypothetical protein
VLWIKGNPGAGKSTLMKHAFSRCQEYFFRQHLIVAYFFNAQGETLEKTLLGLLRSIIYQLVQKDEALYEAFAPSFREKQSLGGGASWEWRLSELQDFIRWVIKHSQSRPLLLLVDALDECDQSDVRNMVEFLESLSIHASQNGFMLHICLSSRHYPGIGMRRVAELAIDRSPDHQEDITKYIGERLRIPDVQLKAEIAQRANGVFLWVAIVVSRLNKAYDEGRVETIRSALQEFTGDLERIFSTILKKVHSHAAEATLMLQWVLLSQRPLKPRELFAATIREVLPAIEVIQKRISESSGGLIEVREGEAGSVQFIHLSVSDFLLQNNRLEMLDQTLGPEPFMASHGRLWARCWSCIRQVELDPKGKSVLSMAELKDKDPFLGYAADYILDHAERGLTRDAMSQWLQGQGGWFQWFPWWKEFLSTSFGNERVGLRDDRDVGFVYILACRGLPNLLRMYLHSPEVNMQCGKYGNPLQAAAYEGHREIVQLLLSAGASVNARGGLFGNALQAASVRGNREIVHLLLGAGADVHAQGGHYGNALQASSFYGDPAIVQVLLNAGANVHAQGGLHGNALQAASVGGHQEIVRMLQNTSMAT